MQAYVYSHITSIMHGLYPVDLFGCEVQTGLVEVVSFPSRFLHALQGFHKPSLQEVQLSCFSFALNSQGSTLTRERAISVSSLAQLYFYSSVVMFRLRTQRLLKMGEESIYSIFSLYVLMSSSDPKGRVCQASIQSSMRISSVSRNCISGSFMTYLQSSILLLKAQILASYSFFSSYICLKRSSCWTSSCSRLASSPQRSYLRSQNLQTVNDPISSLADTILLESRVKCILFGVLKRTQAMDFLLIFCSQQTYISTGPSLPKESTFSPGSLLLHPNSICLYLYSLYTSPRKLELPLQCQQAFMSSRLMLMTLQSQKKRPASLAPKIVAPWTIAQLWFRVLDGSMLKMSCTSRRRAGMREAPPRSYMLWSLSRSGILDLRAFRAVPIQLITGAMMLSNSVLVRLQVRSVSQTSDSAWSWCSELADSTFLCFSMCSPNLTNALGIENSDSSVQYRDLNCLSQNSVSNLSIFLAPTNRRCQQSSNRHSVGPNSTTNRLVLAYPTSTNNTVRPLPLPVRSFTRVKLYYEQMHAQSSTIRASLAVPAISAQRLMILRSCWERQEGTVMQHRSAFMEWLCRILRAFPMRAISSSSGSTCVLFYPRMKVR